MGTRLFVQALVISTFFTSALASLTITNPIANQLSFNSISPASISSATIISSGDVGIIVPPKWSFSIGFLSDTCLADDDEVTYLIQDTPDWVTFSEKTLTLYGVSPSHPVNASMSLVCEYQGQQVLQEFQVRVGRQLELKAQLPSITSSPRNRVSYDAPSIYEILTVDGKHLSDTQKGSLNIDVDGEAGSWLKWEPSLHNLQGTIPDSYISLNDTFTTIIPITITIDDAFPLKTNLTIAIVPYIFTSTQFPDIIINSTLYFSVQQYVRIPNSLITMDVQPPTSTSWLTFDQGQLSLRGTPPENTSPNEIFNITLNAQDPSTGLVAYAFVRLRFQNTTQNPSIDQAKPSMTGLSRKTIIIIILTTILGTLCLFACIYLALWLCRRRQVSQESSSDEKAAYQISGGSQSLEDVYDLDANNYQGMEAWWNQEPRRSTNSSQGTEDGGQSRRSRSSSRPRTASSDARSPIIGDPDAVALGHSQSGYAQPEIPLLELVLERQSTLPEAIPALHASSSQTQSSIISEHGRLYGCPMPKPPPNLSPEETKEWVDNYVCQWNENYISETSRRSSKRRSSRANSQMEDMDGAPARWDGLPSLAEAESSNFDRSFYSSPAHLPPSTSIARSSSHLSTNSEVHLPSDISSVASWDSLDSWEMERRMNYEEPTRRSDFRAPSTTPKGSRITQATVGASSPTSPITGDFVPSIIVTGEPVSKPTTAPTPVHVVESPPIGGTQISQPSTVGDPATPFPEDEEPIVFFPRPAGCEPGHGMARSPHLEGLSRFSGKSAIG